MCQDENNLKACNHCGLIQVVPPVKSGQKAVCFRCGHSFATFENLRKSANRATALALASLILFPLAIFMPILKIERFGHTHETGILDGCSSLLADGHIYLAGIIFFCSIVFPLLKLSGMLMISTKKFLQNPKFGALIFRLIEIVGRWGMLDVLLVAILVAAVKLSDMVEISPGKGALVFATCVILSLGASAFFKPQAIWEEVENG